MSLRTPLAVIRTSAELALRRARDPESYRESLDGNFRRSRTHDRLVDDLLFLARKRRPARGDAEGASRSAGPAHRCHGEFRHVAELRRICVPVPRESRDNVVVSGNRAALRRLFLVLLDNAIKYSHQDSEVIVAVANGNGRPAVTIEDFGIGIDEAERAHIFKRFYQADKARADGGFGLGLSLADSIARAHRATIDVKSKPGNGSRFRVVFSETSA